MRQAAADGGTLSTPTLWGGDDEPSTERVGHRDAAPRPRVGRDGLGPVFVGSRGAEARNPEAPGPAEPPGAEPAGPGAATGPGDRPGSDDGPGRRPAGHRTG